MKFVYLYKKENCDACKDAKELLLEDINLTIVEINIEADPLAEIGIKLLMNTNKLVIPIIVKPTKGVYILSSNKPRQLVRLVSLEVDPS